MSKQNWQLSTPLDAIIFDCDGTLSAIEGIDELANLNKVGPQVQELTAQAMGQSGMNIDLYEKRLNMVRPTQRQLADVGQMYTAHVMPDTQAVIALFKRLNKAVYIVSAGLHPSVAIFAQYLQVPAAHVYAVGIECDVHGDYVQFDRSSPLVKRDGKRDVVREIQKKSAHTLLIGDGLNDLAAHDLVTRFIGYGGNFYRQNIASQCEYYLTTPSLASMLPLSLTEKELQHLNPAEQALYQKGLHAISDGGVLITDKVVNQ